MFRRLFPDARVTPDDDLFGLLERAQADGLPALWLGCGDQDPVWDANQRLHAACTTAGIEVTTSWVPGAGHDWALWDTEIQQVLDWLPLPPDGED